ncbi:MAG: NACHT domain-containing protein, partial [Planctomycetota bacterium]
MTFDVGHALFELGKYIVKKASADYLLDGVKVFLKKRKIENTIDNSIAQIVEQLVPFFKSERVSESQSQLVVETCKTELADLISDPRKIFAASMDGQKVFDRRYADGRLPEAIRHEKLKDLYAQIFPQIANLVCAYPPVIEQWKIEGFQENFRRFDDLAATLSGVANKIDKIASKDTDSADSLLLRVRMSLAQSVEFKLELVGLRCDRPEAVPLENCFVVPELEHTRQATKRRAEETIQVGSEDQFVHQFGKHKVRAVIVGAPGSGKSTLSQWLQRLLLNQSAPHLACVVRLRDWVSKVVSLPSKEDLLREAVGPHLREEVTPETVRRWCSAGQVTIILDGFDEVPPDKRDGFFNWIKTLDSAIDQAGLILTSRPLTSAHLDELPRAWMSWGLNSFDESRVIDYITRWYKHAPLLEGKSREIDAAALANTWLSDSTLEPLVGTPLMLATLLMVHHLDGKLPKGRANVYQRYVDGMLDLWASRWKVPSLISLPLSLKKRILTRLALHLHMKDLEQLGDAEIEPVMAGILRDLGCREPAIDVLNYFRERSGLLIGPGTWNFVHKSVAEFLVASAICDGDQVD